MSFTQSLPDWCQPKTAADIAFDNEEAKRDAFNQASKALAAEMAQKFDHMLKELDIEYSGFHQKCAARSDNSAQQELASDFRDSMLNAAEYPNPDNAGDE